MDYLKEIKKFHTENIEPYTGKPIGCSQDEINELEKYFGYFLPEAYRQYLEWMGRDFKGVFVGSDWFITNVLDNTELLPKLLAENKIDYKLPQYYLVFFSHQGYMAAWFELPKQDDDPITYFFTESKEVNHPSDHKKFTDALFTDMQNLASVLPRTHKMMK
jgi:hypothetical protein